MASVWLARFGGRKGFERLVVVKMILPQYSQDPRFQEMFVDEARIASKIEHANVARILDVGEEDDNTFIVMEWVDGDSLSKILRAAEAKKTKIPAGVALRICADAAAGLHAAHTLKERDGTDLGVVHRDVSPQNILIANSGTTVIIDFGVAKARDRVSQDTSAGQLKGKIRYMAPEQAVGKPLDHRADVWALGAILYEIFGGKPPFDGPNEVATLHKLTSAAPPDPLPPSVPAPVRAVIERALAHDPEARYATALEMNLALETAMVEIGESTSVSVVGHYTAQLLADRKEARKKAVDTALQAARSRETGTAPPVAMSSSSPPISGPMPSAGAMRELTPSVRPQLEDPARITARLSHSPAIASDPPISLPPTSGPFGIAESPSAASNATLGSSAAALDYPPLDVVDDPARRRKYVAAAVLGVSVAAGLVGVLLIVFTALRSKDTKDPSAGSAPPAAETTSEGPSLAVTAPAAPPAVSVAAAPSESASAAAASAPAPGTTAATATGTAATTAPTTTTTHKPATTTRKPTPASPPTTPGTTPTTKPDRGF